MVADRVGDGSAGRWGTGMGEGRVVGIGQPGHGAGPTPPRGMRTRTGIHRIRNQSRSTNRRPGPTYTSTATRHNAQAESVWRRRTEWTEITLWTSAGERENALGRTVLQETRTRWRASRRGGIMPPAVMCTTERRFPARHPGGYAENRRAVAARGER